MSEKTLRLLSIGNSFSESVRRQLPAMAAAESAGCDTILSEDLSPEQDYCGIHVENPFKK